MVKTLKHLFTPQHSNNHRPRVLHVEGFLVFAGIILSTFIVTRTLATAKSTILGFASSITPSQVVDQTNRTRAASGLPPLKQNGELASAASAKGSYMCAKQFWAHIAPDGTTPWTFIKKAGYQYAVAGENLARDFSDTGSVISAWMASPTHRANIVNDRYKDIGVAVLDCNLLGSDTALVVQMFGTELAAVPATTKVAAATKPVASPKPSSEEQKTEVAGAQSQPKILDKTNPTLKLETPPPQANPTNMRYLSPLQVVKAVMIAILTVLIVVLLVDLILEHHRHTIRLVGKNLAHILFLAGILLVVLIIKAGIIY